MHIHAILLWRGTDSRKDKRTDEEKRTNQRTEGGSGGLTDQRKDGRTYSGRTTYRKDRD